MNFDIFSKKASPFYDEVLTACRRIISMDGMPAKVEMEPSAYVLQGNTFKVRTTKGLFSFWLGVNGPRLFFITHARDIDPERARAVFSFCFGGAQKVGWDINFEPLDNGVSIWGTCMTDRRTSLTEKSQNSTQGLNHEPVFHLTEDGLFWALDVAMMVQSWIRTSERNKIECHEMEPAPL